LEAQRLGVEKELTSILAESLSKSKDQDRLLSLLSGTVEKGKNSSRDLQDILKEVGNAGGQSASLANLAANTTAGGVGSRAIGEVLGDVELDRAQKLEALKRAISEIEKNSAKDKQLLLEREAGINERIGSLVKAEVKEKENALKAVEGELDLRKQLEKRLEQAPKRARLSLGLIEKENERVNERIASEKIISELKRGNIQQQIQAVVEEKKLSLAQNSNLSNIEKQIKLLEKQGRSTSELEAVRAEASKALEDRARAEAQSGIKALLDGEAEKKRSEALAEVEAASEGVTKSEKGRVTALKTLQDSNKRVIDLQKKVSSTGEKVSNVFLSIAAAQRNMSNVVEQSFATIRASVRTALGSAGFERIASVATSLNTVISLEQRLNIVRQEGLEESLRISQEQAKTLLSIGERIATGGPGARQDAIRGISTAQAIQGGASISSFTPADLKLALGVENLFPGLKEAVQTQALATLGLDDELSSLKSNIVTAAGAKAEQTAGEQLRVAGAQLSAQLQSLVEAKNAERIAQDDLSLSQDAALSDRAKLDLARAHVIISERALSEAQFQNRNILDLKNSLSTTGASNIGNAARGTLSGQELRGLEMAASREKALMPAGSKLMLANTSETVLTRKQSRSMGFSPRNQSNAANGNADVSGLATLMSQVVARLDQLNSNIKTGGVNNVSLQVDTNKNINVKGISGLGQQLESELTNKFASGNDVSAIKSAVMDIIAKLGEAGLSDDLGR